jgi:pilus assembly protein CpaB
LLLVVAVVIALVGAALVYLYVRGADQRAESRFDTVDVLVAVQPVEPGETIDDAAANGKLALQPVASDYLQPNYQTSTDALSGSVATQRIYPGEQIVADKFGAEVDTPVSALSIPKGMIAISVSLTDTARVAGFIEPGTKVSVFLTNPTYTRLLLEEVEVIAVGSTATTQTTTTDSEGTQTVEQLPSTLMTLAVDQTDAEKVLYSQQSGELAFALLTEDSDVNPSGGTTSADLFR